MKHVESNNPHHKKILWTCGWVLSFFSGSINMVASYAFVFARVSHMTGPASDLSRFLVTDARMAGYILLMVGAFVLGAYLSAVVAKHVKFSTNLMLSTLPALIAMLLIVVEDPVLARLGSQVFAVLLPMGMGWQNGATSQSEIGRTTHVTGDITDLGLKIAQGDWAKAMYYGVKFSSFVLGGISGLILIGYGSLVALILSVVGIVMTGMVIGTIDNKKQPIHVKDELKTALELSNSNEMNQVTANI